MEKVYRLNPESPAQKLNTMYWSDEEARIVGNLISTGQTPKPNFENKELWKKLKIPTDFSIEEIPFLVETANSKIELEALPNEAKKENNQPVENDYTYTTKKRSEIATRIVLSAIEKSGINEALPRVSVKPGFRLKDASTGYSHDALAGERASKQGFIEGGLGGPEIVSRIFSPGFKEDRDFSDTRQLNSLAHELHHVINSLTNGLLWKNSEKNAEEAGLKTQDQFDPEAEKKIGGYVVGSSLQGADENGEFFSLVVAKTKELERRPTISEIVPEVKKSILKTLNRPKEGKKIKHRYLSGKIALLHHLEQLENLGYSNTPAIRLVALSSLGYSSLEKMPTLIKLGVMDKDKFEKINYVMQNITSWLASKSEDGFKLS